MKKKILILLTFSLVSLLESEQFSQRVARSAQLSISLQSELSKTVSALFIADDFQKILIAQKAAALLAPELTESKEEPLDSFVFSIQKGYLEEYAQLVEKTIVWYKRWFRHILYFFNKKEQSFVHKTALLVDFYCHFELSHIFSHYETTLTFFAHQKQVPFPPLLAFWKHPEVHYHLLKLIQQFSTAVKIQLEVGVELAEEDTAAAATKDLMDSDMDLAETEAADAATAKMSANISKWTKATDIIQAGLNTLGLILSVVTGDTSGALLITSMRTSMETAIENVAEDVTSDAIENAAIDSVDDAFDSIEDDVLDATEDDALNSAEAGTQYLKKPVPPTDTFSPQDLRDDDFDAKLLQAQYQKRLEQYEKDLAQYNKTVEDFAQNNKTLIEDSGMTPEEYYESAYLKQDAQETARLTAARKANPLKLGKVEPDEPGALESEPEEFNVQKYIEKQMKKAQSKLNRDLNISNRIGKIQNGWKELKDAKWYMKPFKAIKLAYRSIVGSVAIPVNIIGKYITDPINIAYESAFGDLIKSVEDNALKKAIDGLPHWMQAPTNILLMMTISSGGSIVTSWVSSSDQAIYMQYAQEQNAMAALNTQISSEFKAQTSNNQNTAYNTFDNATKTTADQKKNILSLFLAETQFRNQSMVSINPQNFFTVEDSETMELDQFFQNSTMLTPDTINLTSKDITDVGAWHNVYRLGNWQYVVDNQGGYFYQTEIVKLTGTSALEQATQALQNRIFREYIPPLNLSYTFSFECTLINHDDFFFAGALFNNARWISGVPDRSHQHRFAGLFGQGGKVYQVFEESQLSSTGNTPHTEWPIYRILQNPTNYQTYPFTIGQLPLTFTLNITSEPNQVMYSLVQNGTQSKTPATPLTITNLAPPNFDFHGIGFVAAGCSAKFRVIAPQELTYNAQQIEQFKTVMTSS